MFLGVFLGHGHGNVSIKSAKITSSENSVSPKSAKINSRENFPEKTRETAKINARGNY